KIRVEEYAIFRDGPAKATAVLIHMEGRYRGSIERRPRIECAVPQILEYAAMKLIAAGLGDDIDLSASSGTAFRSVDGGVYTELGDRFQRDLQSRFRFLWLFLDAAGINAIEREVVVVSGTAVEADIAFRTTSSIDGTRSHQHQCCERPAVDWNFTNLP